MHGFVLHEKSAVARKQDIYVFEKTTLRRLCDKYFNYGRCYLTVHPDSLILPQYTNSQCHTYKSQYD